MNIKKGVLVKLYFTVILAILTFSGCGNNSNENSRNLINMGDFIDKYKSPKSFIEFQSVLDSSKSLQNIERKSFDFKSILGSLDKIIPHISLEKRGFKILEIKESRTYGSSGYIDLNMSFDSDTESFTGIIKFVNYISEEDEPNNCSNSLGSLLNGEFTISGDVNESSDIVNMSMEGLFTTFTISFYFKAKTINGKTSYFDMKVQEDSIIDGITLKKDSTFYIKSNLDSAFDEDDTTTLNLAISKDGETIIFKNFTDRTYSNFDSNLEYSYPISGDIEIISSNLKGYFSIDTDYNHQLTPSVTKTENCIETTIRGEEHYIGKDSSLIWRAISEGKCILELDRDGDGQIDEIINDECN